MKYIYVTLVKSITVIGTITRFLTKYPFSHVSICLDKKLEKFYSFSRYYYNSPLISGFTTEYRNHLAAKRNVNLHCRVYRVPVTDEEYKRIEEKIYEMKRDKDLMYNYYSLITMKLLGGLKVYKSYTCCSFVAEILDMIEHIKLPKKPDEFYPKDFETLLGDKYFYLEKDFEISKKNTHNYYKNVPFFKRLKRNIYALKEATYRLIFKKKSKNYKYTKIYIKPHELEG